LELEEIINRAVGGQETSVEDIATMLSVGKDDAGTLFSAARSVRDDRFGKKTYVYGFVYFSTYCKNNCTFCYYRKTNGIMQRYRKSTEEVLALAESLSDAGINLVDLTMGEDPVMYADDHRNLIDLVQRVNDDVDIAIMISPGAIPEDIMPKLKNAGADWFACYQEVYNRELFAKLRLDQDYDTRLNQKIWAQKAGLLTEDGMMVGLGETVPDRARTILKMGSLGCEQIRAMTFVPQEGTPMGGMVPTDSFTELKCIAVMRILFPDRLIPASLDVEGIAGLKTRIDAGANVITSIVPPHKDLAGVAQHDLDIDNGYRSFDHVKDMLEEMGRRPATQTEYSSFVAEHESVIRGGK
jgi:methylornithine synthase